MKIYTRTGDDGRTGLFGGERVSKSHPRVEAYGTVDELNASLGVAAAAVAELAVRLDARPPVAARESSAPGAPDAAWSPAALADLSARLASIQSRLFDVGAVLATPAGAAAASHLPEVREAWVSDLESDIDALTAQLPPLSSFVLPGGTPAAAALHVARTVCRRAERRVFQAIELGEDVPPPVPRYLNRLGDWLFTAARAVNAADGRADVPWVPSTR